MNRVQKIRQLKKEDRKNYFKPLRYPDIPLLSSDLYIRTTIGDRLDSLADRFYNDVRLWWVIATANPQVIRRDSYNLKPNLEIRIPANTSEIVKKFEQLNQ